MVADAQMEIVTKESLSKWWADVPGMVKSDGRLKNWIEDALVDDENDDDDEEYKSGEDDGGVSDENAERNSNSPPELRPADD